MKKKSKKKEFRADLFIEEVLALELTVDSFRERLALLTANQQMDTLMKLLSHWLSGKVDFPDKKEAASPAEAEKTAVTIEKSEDTGGESPGPLSESLKRMLASLNNSSPSR